jgi:2'-5' RNA ligase
MNYRCFIALEAPPPVHKSLSARLEEYRRQPGVNWVSPENLHLTLLFLGDVEMARLEELDDAIGKAVEGVEAFELRVLGLELFPAKSPRLVWASLKEAEEAIFHLHRKLLSALRDLGLDPDPKPLKLHITLGRIKRFLPPDFVQRVITGKVDSGVYAYARVSLYRSVLKPEGPVYHLISKYELR